MMRVSFLAIAAVSVAACSSPAEAPVADVAAEVPATAAVVEPVVEMTVEQLCREAARRLYDQSGPTVTFDAETFDISWPAPVDGGRLAFACGHAGTVVSLTRDGNRQTVDVSASTAAPTQQGAQ